MAEFRLTVLNPGGRDPAQNFSTGIASPDDGGHAPVNFHGYAACTRGVFHRKVKHAIAEGLPVLLLLRSDFTETQRALHELQRHGLPVAVALKETGLHQIEKQLGDPNRATRFREIVGKADGCLAATSEAVQFYRAGQFIPTPYPLTDPRWDFSRPLGERKGIFVGTREWDVPSRHHLAALVLALETGEPVTVFDEDPKQCRKVLAGLGLPVEELRIIRDRLPYLDYLREMAQHKLVVQADQSAVPGQVAGDALLCRLPCVGGNGAIDRIGFPSTSGYGRSLGELAELTRHLLREPGFYQEITHQSQEQAREQLDFAVVSAQLEQFFGQVGAS
ncbi:MAG: hypothetical protein M3Q46_07870 [Verrucomicrobiota bacterium]|nr:hypothetical protein [Verrucomicrobiota bacterium]